MDINSYPLSRQLGEQLSAAGMKIAVAESCTGGDLSRIITRVMGSSQWFDRGFITYSNQSKIEMLGVDAALIKTQGAVSEEVAIAIDHSDADITVGITGVAGPEGGTPEKPVGTVWIAVALKNGHCEVRKTFFESGRKHIRMCTVAYTLRWLLQEIEKLKTPSDELIT